MRTYDFEGKIGKYTELLSAIGADEKGGITRLLYTPEWKAAQEQVKALMENQGMVTQYDSVGNLFGRVEGAERKDETIMIGSHIDTVRNGGRYDGQFGIIAGLLAADCLKQHYGEPKRNIEVVSIAEEEGSRFPFTFWGAKNILGIANPEEVKDLKDAQGIRFEDAMRSVGFDFQENSLRKDIKKFIELHIEQGSVLEREGESLGLVTAIVGQKRYNIEVTGESNHAGSTPMGYRRDTVYAASKMISYITEKACEYGDPLVATVGFLEVTPNVVNVVPGNTKFSLDVRHTDPNILDAFTAHIEQKLIEIAQMQNVEVDIHNYMNERPVPMNEALISKIQHILHENGVKFKVMHSGAGHDSQMMAQYVPTAMSFIPSINGISHNPLENTEMKDLVFGIESLIYILKELAY